MTTKHLLVEYLNNLSANIYQPLQVTQRIKYTSFDISTRYALFGATSGGIYIFNRHPCTFLKLVPSKEGSLTKLAISSDEKTIAACTPKGYILIFQNCITDPYVKPKVFTEFEGNIITEIKWHGSSLYCGDNSGKISVIKASAIFQPSCSHLMSLESGIVQIDAIGRFLLISTKTRSLLADTNSAHFKQIGKKLRDGNYGACFFDPNRKMVSQTDRGFLTPTNEDIYCEEQLADVKIYCARPGCRLWEANFEPVVVCTHQFKNSVMQFPSYIICMDQDKDHRLNLKDASEADYVSPDKFSFEKVFILDNKFLLTYNSEGFYILDVSHGSVLFWSNKYKNIKDIKIYKNYMYIWSSSSNFNIVSLFELEALVLDTLFHKKYFICSELCVYFMSDVLSLIENSEKIRLIAFLKSKLAEIKNNSFLEQLQPIFEKIKKYNEIKALPQTFKTGIHVVENIYSLDKEENYSNSSETDDLPEPIQALLEIGNTVSEKISESTQTIKDKLQILQVTVRNLTGDEDRISLDNSEIEKKFIDNEKSENYTEVSSEHSATENVHSFDVENSDGIIFNNKNDIKDIENDKIPNIDVNPLDDKNCSINTLYKYYQLCKINSNAEVAKLNEFFATLSISDVAKLLDNFLEYIHNLNIDDSNVVKIWSFKQYLKYFSTKNVQLEISNLDIESSSFNFLTDALQTLNVSNASCDCCFPLPNAKENVPQFYNIGCALLKSLWNHKQPHTELLKNVPHLWKYMLSNLVFEENVNNLLPVIVQLNDKELFMQFSHKFNYNLWEDTVKLFIKLKSGLCINCDRKFDLVKNATFSWTTMANIIVQSMGGPITVKLLMKYSKDIPSSELDASFYQTCIFLETLNNLSEENLKDRGMQFMEKVNSNNDISMKWDSLMTFYLRKKQTSNDKEVTASRSLCTSCDLPLNTPIMTNTCRANCGHCFHKFCILNIEKVFCKICNIYVTYPDNV